MKAKIESSVNTNREDLGKVVPLDTPFVIFMDVCNICNFKCRFCAAQSSERSLRFKKMAMHFEDYKKIVDDMKGFPRPLKMLRLTGNGEPLINKNLPEMIAYAKEAGVAEYIENLTNGSLLTHELSDRLIAAGLDRLRISIEGPDQETYREMCQADIDWQSFLDEIKYFYENRSGCELYIKTVDAAVDTQEKKDLFFSTFGDMCDKIFIEHVAPVWAGFDEIFEDFDISKDEGLYGNATRNTRICQFPFYTCMIEPDGEVLVCCSDWERKTKLGSALESSIVDIWRGEKFRNFLLGMLEKGRVKNMPDPCGKCYNPCYNTVDNLDADAEAILERMRKQAH